MEESFRTVSEAAEELRLEQRSVRDKLTRGKIKGAQPGGGGTRWLIPRSKVDRLLGPGETIAHLLTSFVKDFTFII